MSRPLPYFPQRTYSRMRMTESVRFNCPNCGAGYKIVRLVAESSIRSTCRRCGGRLQASEGAYILKYFLVDRPKGVASTPRGAVKVSRSN